MAAARGSVLPQRQYGLPFPSEPPPEPELLADEQTIETMLSPDYWRRICPQLSVGAGSAGGAAGAGGGAAGAGGGAAGALELGEGDVAALRSLLEVEGYFLLQPDAMSWEPGLMESLARGVVQLMQCGWPPAFLAMFDEAWALQAAIDAMMGQVTGGNRNNMDFLAWYIDPGDGSAASPAAAGFAPHRDRQPRDIAASFKEGGEPKYLTCWLPFTDASPENSCLYVIPKSADPSYMAGDDMDDPDSDPMDDAIAAAPRRFQDVRALPVAAGGAVCFTHRIIHWGSAARPGYPTPRIACSWAATADDYEEPYFSREHLPLPPVGLRASLCAGQQLNYYKRFRPSKHRLDLYNRVFGASSAEFNAHYRTKVLGEYQWAKFELAAQRTSQPSARRKRREGAADSATENATDAPEEAPPAPDMEEEMRTMFGGVGLAAEDDEDEFEAAVWNGSEWVDADAGEGG